jgi:hypothetical protein
MTPAPLARVDERMPVSSASGSSGGSSDAAEPVTRGDDPLVRLRKELRDERERSGMAFEGLVW